MRVSLMLDSNGANTTAAAAVLSARKHVPLKDAVITVLGATGSVGKRVVRLLAREHAKVRVASRQLSRAQQVCENVNKLVDDADLQALETRGDDSVRAAVADASVVIAAGAPGVELLSEKLRRECRQLKVAIDLNAVPPTGIAGIQPHDKAADQNGQICYGAIGVGGLKMKLHKAAIRRLFESNDALLDAEEIYDLGNTI
jgi:glutamyl-tRNA reductase